MIVAVEPGVQSYVRYVDKPKDVEKEGFFHAICVSIAEDTDIVGVYCNPTMHAAQLQNLLHRIKRKAKPRTIIVGDFNGRHKTWDHKGNARGKAIFSFTQTTCFNVYAPAKPTFRSRGNPTAVSTINLILNNAPERLSPEIAVGPWEGATITTQ